MSKKLLLGLLLSVGLQALNAANVGSVVANLCANATYANPLKTFAGFCFGWFIARQLAATPIEDSFVAYRDNNILYRYVHKEGATVDTAKVQRLFAPNFPVTISHFVGGLETKIQCSDLATLNQIISEFEKDLVRKKFQQSCIFF